MNPLNTIKGTIVAGVVLAIVIGLLFTFALDLPFIASQRTASLIVWIHVLAGITWIGLLYYFNFVQVPALAAAAADQGGPGGAGISKYVAPRALLWFRWGAVVTWLSGAAYLLHLGLFDDAFLLNTDNNGYLIGVGAWLGTIMLFNVWVFIWPNQKKILGIVTATDDEKAKARKVALYASRANFILSVPMLMCMGGQSHGLPF